MRVVVFGASGPTGRELLRETLARGHRATAFVRRAEALGSAFPDLPRVVGDVLEPAAVQQAIL